MGGSENLPVGPGILGFIAVFVIAVALWFLMRNMNARVRRMSYRERDRLEHERREQASRDAVGPGVASGGFDGPGEADHTRQAVADESDERRSNPPA